MTDSLDFLVSRTDLRRTRVAPQALAVDDGQALLQVERFALTANNVTYAVFGDAMAYWKFFPVQETPAEWGRVPVWGHAVVVESRHPDIAVGERVYGYLPMSTHVVVQPDRITPEGFVDSSAHRRPLPAPYQWYGRCAKDPMHVAGHEDERALLNPLFVTSFLIDDFFSDNGWFGAEQVVLASASSKTALGVAFLAKPTVIGLTSPKNKGFCESLGHYDSVIPYDALETLPKVPTVFVDMAGDGRLLAAVHHHFGDQLKYSCIVGATHWEHRETQHALPGAKPQFFFAPTQAQKRRKDWGPGGLEQRFGAAWKQFLPSAAKWMQVRRASGQQAVSDTWLEVLDGRAAPTAGHILSL